jgi:hypothetical protein
MSDNEIRKALEQDGTDAGAGAGGAGAKRPSRKKAPKRALIITGIVVAVIAVIGVGGVIWHNSPGFCGTICHTPMKSYVEGFTSGDPNLLVTAHVKEGKECLDCHEATIGEQIKEAQVWIAGDFETPLEPSGIGTREFCLDCHDIQEIMAATDDYAGLYERGVSTGFQGLAKGLNPHRSHMENLQCGDCHQMHQESVMQCNECHYLPLPEGWSDVWDGKGTQIKEIGTL